MFDFPPYTCVANVYLIFSLTVSISARAEGSKTIGSLTMVRQWCDGDIYFAAGGDLMMMLAFTCSQRHSGIREGMTTEFDVYFDNDIHT
jgi:hypothetical protein